jgi:uncharacterized protein involved in type VI secretion and phage assembly
VSGLVDTIRAIVRDELAGLRLLELGTVTRVHAREDDGSKNNHQVDVRLRTSGVELNRAAVAVDRLGVAALPAEGDLVVVAFVAGDLNAPVVVGCVYDDQAHPPVGGPEEVVYQPPEESGSGVRRLHLELPNGSLITLEEDTLTVDWGGTSIVMANGGDVTIQAGGNIKLAAEGNIEIDAKGDVKATAQANLEMQGISAKVEGQAEAKVKGAQVSLAGNTQFSPA